MLKYKIGFALNPDNFSTAFQDFFTSHFENSKALTRGEVDKYFFNEMTDEELDIAKRIVRDNLDLVYNHLYEAAGDLHDNDALLILYEHLEKAKDLSRQLTIGQAIWKINGDPLYPDLLRKLQNCNNHITKEAHFEQVTDLQNLESIDMLLTYIKDEGEFVRHLALSKLNFLLTGKRSYDNQFPEEYFVHRRNDEAFINTLLLNLKNISN